MLLRKEIRKPMKFLLLAAVSVLFLLIYSSATSPLTNFYGGDSSFFTLVGKGMTEGMLPYRDFFDMKGPYLFLIEYVGQLICSGRTGAFIMQCLNLFFCLCIVDKIYHDGKGPMTVGTWLLHGLLFIVPCLIVASFTFEGGNLTEEYSLPLLLLSLYFALGYLKRSDEDLVHPLKQGFFYGFAFGVLALIRITNAALIGAILVTISIDLILRRKIGNLLLNGLMFLLGCAAAFAPMCVYFGVKGLLGEMLSQVFVFGVQYSSEVGMAEKFAQLVSRHYRTLITMTFPLVVLAVFRVKNWKYWLFAASSYLLFLLAATMGNAYIHYFTLGIPNLVLGFVVLIRQLEQVDFSVKKLSKFAIIVMALVFLIMSRHYLSSALNGVKRIVGASGDDQFRQQILQISEQIPQEDRDSVYVYGLKSCSNWYLQADLMPTHRYCDWQEHYIELNPEIGTELAQWIGEQNPRWIVVAADAEGMSPVIARAISTGYTEHMRNESYILYTCRDNSEK